MNRLLMDYSHLLDQEPREPGVHRPAHTHGTNARMHAHRKTCDHTPSFRTHTHRCTHAITRGPYTHSPRTHAPTLHTPTLHQYKYTHIRRTHTHQYVPSLKTPRSQEVTSLQASCGCTQKAVHSHTHTHTHMTTIRAVLIVLGQSC